MKKQLRTSRLAYLVSFMALLLAAAFLLPQLPVLAEGLSLLPSAEPLLLAAAILCMAATYFFAAYALGSLSMKRLSFKDTLIVQFASGFASKLVPAGIGGLALNTRYLVKQRHTVVQAGSVMAVNGGLGFLGHIVILLAGLVFARQTAVQTIHPELPAYVWYVATGLVLAALAMLLVSRNIRAHLARLWKQAAHIPKQFVGRPLALVNGFAGTVGVTACFALALYLCAYALGQELGILEVLLVYTAGAIGTAVIPTPGGIGAAEAVLAASMIALGVDAPVAVSIAVLYRLIVFWLPIIPGLVFFRSALHNKII